MALDRLLFTHQLQQLMEKCEACGRLGMASKPEQPQVPEGPAPTTPTQSPKQARSRRGQGPGSPTAMGRDVTRCSWDPEGGQASVDGKPASAGLTTPDPAPVQLHLARLCPADSPNPQGSAAGTGSAKPGAAAGGAAVGPSLAASEHSLRAEGLRAQHWGPLLRLRETTALEEEARQEHQRGCLGHPGPQATGAALVEKTRQALSRLEEARREIRGLRNLHGSVCLGRQQLLQQQEAIAQRPLPPLPQSPGTQVKAAWEGASETGLQLEGAPCPPTLCRPGNPTGPQAQRGSASAVGTCLASEQWEETPKTPAGAPSHQQLPRPASGEATAKASSPPEEGGSCVDQEPCNPHVGHLHSHSLEPGQLLSSACPTLQAEGDTPAAQLAVQAAPEPPAGDSKTQAGAHRAEKRPAAPRDGPAHDCQGQHLQRPGADGPHGPQEASQTAEESTCQAGLCVTESPMGEPLEVESRSPSEQRTETCQQDSSIPLAASPAPVALKKEAHPTQPRPATPVHPGSELATGLSWKSSGSLASPPLSSADSGSGLSCSSLQEFRKATAILVQLSDSSLSLSSPEAEGSVGTGPSWSEELSAHGDFGPPASWGLRQGDPQPGSVSGGSGPVTQQRLECGQAAPSLGAPGEAASAENSIPKRSSLQAEWPPPPQDASSPRSGSELSDASSQIWDEDIGEDLPEPGRGAQPCSGSALPPGCSSWERSMALTTSGPGQGQAPSGASWSLGGGSNTGSPKQVSSEATSTGDVGLSLSFPPGTSASERARCWERPQGLSLSSGRSPPQASARPEVPCGLASPVAKGQAAGRAGHGTPQGPEQAGPPHGAGFQVEIPPPVHKEWHYGSGTLPGALSWDARLLPPPPPPHTDSDEDEAQPCPDDFPSPPQEAMAPQDSLEEDTSITEDLSLSEEALRQAPSLGPQELGLCLKAPWPCRDPDSQQAGSGSTIETQASGGQWSEQVTWPESPLGVGVGSVHGGLPRAPAQPLLPSRVACAAGEGLPRLLGASDPSVVSVGLCALTEAPGQCVRPQEGLRRFASALRQGGSGTPASPSPGPVPLVARGQAGSPGHTGEEGAEGLACWAEDSLGKELRPGKQSATGHGPLGTCSNLMGTERDGAVVLVSTQLTQRILLDSMAALAPGGSP
ncbi:collagen alpha-1(I) chain [Octodon degus]|uniref:Collagen alpha-1(I) chain n=1 Tax=Octodon degus TaxID=10160 RepID=A0A6P6D914_OCTDE|nr:collagen alpha-1(I) chain [Octodon degus]